MPSPTRPRFRLRRFTNLNGDDRLRISAGQPRPVILSADEAAQLCRLLLDQPDVAEAFRLANLADVLGR